MGFGLCGSLTRNDGVDARARQTGRNAGFAQAQGEPSCECGLGIRTVKILLLLATYLRVDAKQHVDTSGVHR